MYTFFVSESALGAASHTGQIEIVEFLLEKGARMDIFAAAVLGDLAVVRAMVQERPHLKYSVGPHGIRLLEHAAMGGPKAAPVYQYIKQQLKENE
ncbi:MAG: hypothetical protein ACRC5C_14920 [Bacilli bacterium]